MEEMSFVQILIATVFTALVVYAYYSQDDE